MPVVTWLHFIYFEKACSSAKCLLYYSPDENGLSEPRRACDCEKCEGRENNAFQYIENTRWYHGIIS